MSPISNPRLVFKASVTPDSGFTPNKHLSYDGSETIDPETVSLNGGLLLKTVYLSLDPYMFMRMAPEGSTDYPTPPFKVGDAISGDLVGEVVRSENPAFPAGQFVHTKAEFKQYVVIPERSDPVHCLAKLQDIPFSVYLGLLGMPGLTAYCGLQEYGKLERGQTIFVSAGSGAVGSVVIQLAKNDGLKVIASAGSESKVEHMRELGADVAFNYKTESTQDVLEKHGPLDVYWDNVGGETLDAALRTMKEGGRIIMCGMISSYNQEPFGYKNLMQIVGKGLTVHGFMIRQLASKYDMEFYATMPSRVASRQFKFREEVYKGWESAPDAFKDMLTGNHEGKVIIQVGDS